MALIYLISPRDHTDVALAVKIDEHSLKVYLTKNHDLDEFNPKSPQEYIKSHPYVIHVSREALSIQKAKEYLTNSQAEIKQRLGVEGISNAVRLDIIQEYKAYLKDQKSLHHKNKIVTNSDRYSQYKSAKIRLPTIEEHASCLSYSKESIGCTGNDNPHTPERFASLPLAPFVAPNENINNSSIMVPATAALLFISGLFAVKKYLPSGRFAIDRNSEEAEVKVPSQSRRK